MISNGCACPKRLLTWLVSWELFQVPHSQSWTKLINLQVSMQQQRRLERRLLMNTYNHIYGLSISGLQFFTIYAPGVRPNMTYFSFTPDIFNWETHQHIYQGANNKDLAHDFTYIDDVVKTGCVASLDVVDKSTSSGGKKTGHVWLCIFNLGVLVLQTLLPTFVDILQKYLNLKSKREIVEMPCDGDVPFTDANNISAAQA
jgi:UDP-glucuronate 4-epimerase